MRAAAIGTATAVALALAASDALAQSGPSGAGGTAQTGPGGAASKRRDVSGGGSFNAAPILTPGAYADTIEARETLYYGIRLQPGQKLSVVAKVDTRPSGERIKDLPNASEGLFIGDIYSPVRQPFTDSRKLGVTQGQGFGSVSVSTSAPVVLPTAKAPNDSGAYDAWRGPGIYTFTINISDLVYSLGPRVELPMTLDFTVTGTPQRDPDDVVAAPTPRPSAPAKTTKDDGGTSTPAKAGIGIGGVLVGALMAFGALGRRRA